MSDSGTSAVERSNSRWVAGAAALGAIVVFSWTLSWWILLCVPAFLIGLWVARLRSRQTLLGIAQVVGLDDVLSEPHVANQVRGRVEELRATRSALAAVRQERDALLQALHGGVLVVDSAHRIVRVDRAAEELLGVSESGARGRLVQEVARHAELNRFVEEAISIRQPQEMEMTLRGAAIRRIRALSAPLEGAFESSHGSALGALVVLIDVTDLRRLESLRSDFAANASHELRTPITNIKGYVETLLDSGLSDQEEAMGFIHTIARNADRLGTIIDGLLTLTRLERAQEAESLETEWVSLAALVEEVERELQAQAEAAGVSLVTEISQELAGPMDRDLLRLAISNLIGNAIKYSGPPAGKRVWITGSTHPSGESSELVLEVRDEGPGIGEEHLERLFERFYRVDRARSRDAGGTGLGLAIVKHIAQLHGGSVQVVSQIGVGSSFTLRLPTGRDSQ